jgi:hypothetical protein
MKQNNDWKVRFKRIITFPKGLKKIEIKTMGGKL